jgi:hypothetical protein
MSIRTTRLIVIGAGLALVLAGLLRDDALMLWRRATQLCLGCIGIG